MRTFYHLWKKELTGYFLSPVAYVTTVFFLAVMGFIFWLLASLLTKGPMGVPVMNLLFGSPFFWMTLLIVAPVLTMRLFAEEKRSGTMETLLTAPVSDTAVVLAKFSGVLAFYIIMWLPTIFFVVVLDRYSSVSAPVDFGPVAGGYLGAFLVGAFYLSVGMLCSSLTNSQIIAAISGFAVMILLFFSGFLEVVAFHPVLLDTASYMASHEHMVHFSRGTIDTRPILYYLSGTAFALFATVKVIESRRWS